MSLITGSVSLTLALNGTNNQAVYSRPNQVFSVFGNELITALNQFIPPGGITVTLPNNGSGVTVSITETSLSDNIATYTYIPGSAPLVPGQNVTIINCTNNAVFNVTNQVIVDVFQNTNPTTLVTIYQFTVAVTNADIPAVTEYVATATTSGVSLVYLRNAGNGVVNVTWTPSGGTSETVMPLPAGAEITMSFPSANCGITALSFSSDILQSATVTNVSLTSDVATLTTSNYHGFQVGQLVTTTGITNNSSLFNVTLQPIMAVTNNTFSFSLVHANVPPAAATGTNPEATVSVPASSEASMMEWAVLA